MKLPPDARASLEAEVNNLLECFSKNGVPWPSQEVIRDLLAWKVDWITEDMVEQFYGRQGR